MSPYTTMHITREDARGEIMKNLLSASDDELEAALFELVGRNKLYNFSIVSSYNDDDYCSYKQQRL